MDAGGVIMHAVISDRALVAVPLGYRVLEVGEVITDGALVESLCGGFWLLVDVCCVGLEVRGLRRRVVVPV